MSLFTRWRHRDQSPSLGGGRLMTPLRVLRADGQRIDLTARGSGHRVALTRQEWQTDAWSYRDMIGELRYAHRLLARSVAQCRFYAAAWVDDADEPVDLTDDGHGIDSQLVDDAIANLNRLPLGDGPDGFLATLTENLVTAGEGWIHGETDGRDEMWTVRSISEITSTGDQIMLSELPNSTVLGQRVIGQAEELLRCWVRHPRWGQLADSPLRAMLDQCEQIVLLDREIRAASRSRIAANGLLLLPASLSLARVRETEEDLSAQGVEDDEFMADFTAAVTAPIRAEGDAGAVVPLVLRGEPEALKEVRHLTMDRADVKDIQERLTNAVVRVLRGTDVQPEQVQGVSVSNHWGGWLVNANSIRNEITPTALVDAGCITKAFLRPALAALDHDHEQVRRIVVWADSSKLAENPSRGQDARDAHDRIVISDKSFREALGFGEEHAPEDDEVQRRVALKSGIDQATAAVVLQMPLPGGRGIRVIDATPAQELPAGNTEPDARDTPRAARPGQTVVESPTPAEPTSTTDGGGMVAAASSVVPLGWRVDLATARALTEIDISLTERILTAADAAVARAVERAAGRAKNAVRSKALAAAVEGVDTLLVPHTLGRETLTAAVGVQDLLAGAYARLRDQVTGWLVRAAEATADLVVQLLGLPAGSREARRVHRAVTDRFAVHRPAAWQALQEALDTAADKALFRADPLTPEPGPGEGTDTLVTAGAVRRALVIAGGGRPGNPEDGGLATGPVVRNVVTETGGVVLGWEWQYRPQIPRGSHFEPHQVLDGARFSTWTDPKLDTTEATRWVGPYFHPQDHEGCRCASVAVTAVPDDDPDDIVGRRLREAAQSDRGRLAARVAAQDTAAGRIGTSLQNEVEVRDRITADVARLRAHYIQGATV